MQKSFFIALLFLGSLSATSGLAAQERTGNENTGQAAPTAGTMPAKTPRQLFIENCSAANPAPNGSAQSPSPSCICEADFLASNMKAEQFAIAAALVAFGDDMEAVGQFVTDKIADGTYSAQLFLDTANRLEALAERLGRACGNLPL